MNVITDIGSVVQRGFSSLLLMLALCMVLASCDTAQTRRRMADIIAEADSMNRHYAPMTSDSLLLLACRYYDRHGSPNERMRAHYLLGCAYRDMGEAPQALECYQDAINNADTTSTDCDYKTLCRVYAQMSDVFYYQNLFENQLVSLDRATYYGYLAKDTLAALLAYAQKMDGYKILSLPDSMLYVFESSQSLLQEAGYQRIAAGMSLTPIEYLLDRGDISRAKQLFDIYESESGFFDVNDNIEEGREIYYYIKGYYYLKTCRYDSAEYFFRKELATGRDFNNQNAGMHGLALLFQQTHEPDSAAKYALGSYAMNDSVYAHKTTKEVAATKALYDYTRYAHEAQQSKIDAIQSQLRFIAAAIIAILVLVLAIFFAYGYHSVQKKRRKEKIHYQRLQDSYRRTEKELSELRIYQEQFSRMTSEWKEQTAQEVNRLHQSEQMLKELISEKELELDRLDAELTRYRKKEELTAAASSDEESLLREFSFYQDLLRLTDQGHPLSENDWKAVQEFQKDHLPQFHQFLSDNRHALTDYEYRVCLLVRLYFKPKNIANALGLDASYVTRVRRSMVKKLFGVAASSKEADMLVRQIGRIKGC